MWIFSYSLSQEIKMKKKLIKIIRDRKKKIYSSLMTTVEESMQKCYDGTIKVNMHIIYYDCA